MCGNLWRGENEHKVEKINYRTVNKGTEGEESKCETGERRQESKREEDDSNGGGRLGEGVSLPHENQRGTYGAVTQSLGSKGRKWEKKKKQEKKAKSSQKIKVGKGQRNFNLVQSRSERC